MLAGPLGARFRFSEISGFHFLQGLSKRLPRLMPMNIDWQHKQRQQVSRDGPTCNPFLRFRQKPRLLWILAKGVDGAVEIWNCVCCDTDLWLFAIRLKRRSSKTAALAHPRSKWHTHRWCTVRNLKLLKAKTCQLLLISSPRQGVTLNTST